MLEWPWPRFDAFYDAFAKRKAVEDLTWRKLAHVNALLSIPTDESGSNKKQRALEGLEDQFVEAVDFIYGKSAPEEELDKDNPFFAHAYDGLPPLDLAEDSVAGNTLG